MGDKRLVQLYRNVFEDKFDVTMTVPFDQPKTIMDIDTYWKHMQNFFSEAPNEPRAAIIGIDTKYNSHWTTVIEIYEKRMILMDSEDKKLILRKQATTLARGTKAPTRIHHRETFFFTRKPASSNTPK